MRYLIALWPLLALLAGTQASGSWPARIDASWQSC